MGKIGGWPATGFGAHLRTQREAKGMSQKQLGEASGIHANTIARLERGEQEPAWPAAMALIKALGVSCEAFAAAVTPDSNTEVAEKKPKPGGAKPAAKKPTAKKGKK